MAAGGEEGKGRRRSACLTPTPCLPCRSTVMQQQFNQVNKAELGSVALPGIVRHGAGGPENFQMGTMPQAQQQVTSGQMHRGHMPPLVRGCPGVSGVNERGRVGSTEVTQAAMPPHWLVGAPVVATLV